MSRPPTVVLIGPPGAGKGTQAGLLAGQGYRHVASGDLLRRHIASGTVLGRSAEPYVRGGALVPDELVAGLVQAGLREHTGQPVVIDGFPKTAPQARRLDRILAAEGRRADLVLLFEASPDVLRRRMLSRGQGRADDTAATVERRLADFARVPVDLTDYYRARGVLRPVRADAAVDAVAAEIGSHLSVRPPARAEPTDPTDHL
ncbi:adenylate kinase family protein [Kitasatospora cineracea]|uniref:adenylate kinase family protein n=1 Tax=Kitasatospora cineracea TaxID=88074 RepID=UPI0037FB7A70